MSNRLRWFGPQYSTTPKQNQVLLIALLFFLAPGIVLAQVLYGSLTGTVTDPSGAVLSGAHVTAFEVATGVRQTATSDSSGIYRFPNLLLGTCKITIAAQGFSTQETSGVQVRVNEVARLDAHLRVAGAAETVVVTTEAPLL